MSVCHVHFYAPHPFYPSHHKKVAAALVVRESYSGSNSSGKDPALSTTRGASYDTIIDTAHWCVEVCIPS